MSPSYKYCHLTLILHDEGWYCSLPLYKIALYLSTRLLFTSLQVALYLSTRLLFTSLQDYSLPLYKIALYLSTSCPLPLYKSALYLSTRLLFTSLQDCSLTFHKTRLLFTYLQDCSLPLHKIALYPSTRLLFTPPQDCSLPLYNFALSSYRVMLEIILSSNNIFLFRGGSGNLLSRTSTKRELLFFLLFLSFHLWGAGGVYDKYFISFIRMV